MNTRVKAYNGKTADFVVKNKNEHIQKCWVAGRFYESQKNGILPYFMRNISKYQNKRCIDIGASIGNHTVYFAMILGCEVTSFEPVLESFNHLKENCSLNSINPTLHNIALGEEKKEAGIINNSKNNYNIGMYQVVDGSGIQVNALDNVVEGQFDFIKIDVEHYNIPLLKGAKNTLISQKNCDVFIECETDSILKETDEIMKSYGYTRDIKIKLNHTPTYLWKKNIKIL